MNSDSTPVDDTFALNSFRTNDRPPSNHNNHQPQERTPLNQQFTHKPSNGDMMVVQNGSTIKMNEMPAKMATTKKVKKLLDPPDGKNWSFFFNLLRLNSIYLQADSDGQLCLHHSCAMSLSMVSYSRSGFYFQRSQPSSTRTRPPQHGSVHYKPDSIWLSVWFEHINQLSWCNPFYFQSFQDRLSAFLHKSMIAVQLRSLEVFWHRSVSFFRFSHQMYSSFTLRSVCWVVSGLASSSFRPSLPLDTISRRNERLQPELPYVVLVRVFYWILNYFDLSFYHFHDNRCRYIRLSSVHSISHQCIWLANDDSHFDCCYDALCSIWINVQTVNHRSGRRNRRGSGGGQRACCWTETIVDANQRSSCSRCSTMGRIRRESFGRITVRKSE